ncbi:universal stress protein [Gaetbulibacter saemankumensis]|uniref:universal stress protein n=1 Tax=Gaetbulibacter saemankumensis TaxID=311208 RepID=UPI000405D59F|nr:universal stress protein [Gaetbulibacter saemankumensis]
MENKILIPTDFSDNAWNAVVYALKLFADEPCTFYLLNAVNIKYTAFANFSNKLLKTMCDAEMKTLVELKQLAESSDANANHEFKIIQSTENLNSAINMVVRDKAINLIIMGTKGHTGTKEFFFGSNTVQLINHIKDCPILVIPEEFEFVKPTQIAFPTHFNRSYSKEELMPLMRATELFNSKIRIVHINEEEQLTTLQEEHMKELDSILLDYDHSFHWMPNYANKSAEINDFIQELNIDMLAMINYKHSFIENILREPVVNKIGFHPIVPFLVIPKKHTAS